VFDVEEPMHLVGLKVGVGNFLVDQWGNLKVRSQGAVKILSQRKREIAVILSTLVHDFEEISMEAPCLDKRRN
jgi:hypothetical protein